MNNFMCTSNSLKINESERICKPFDEILNTEAVRLKVVGRKFLGLNCCKS